MLDHLDSCSSFRVKKCACPQSNHTSIGAHLGAVCCDLLPERKVEHPLGCHRPRIPDRVIFEELVLKCWSSAAPTLADSREFVFGYHAA